jgi:hypothetical protein
MLGLQGLLEAIDGSRSSSLASRRPNSGDHLDRSPVPMRRAAPLKGQPHELSRRERGDVAAALISRRLSAAGDG